jgi:hypothetical protein
VDANSVPAGTARAARAPRRRAAEPSVGLWRPASERCWGHRAASATCWGGSPFWARSTAAWPAARTPASARPCPPDHGRPRESPAGTLGRWSRRRAAHGPRGTPSSRRLHPRLGRKIRGTTLMTALRPARVQGRGLHAPQDHRGTGQLVGQPVRPAGCPPPPLSTVGAGRHRSRRQACPGRPTLPRASPWRRDSQWCGGPPSGSAASWGGSPREPPAVTPWCGL